MFFRETNKQKNPNKTITKQSHSTAKCSIRQTILDAYNPQANIAYHLFLYNELYILNWKTSMKKNILIHMNIIWNLKFSFHKDWNTAIHICLNMSMTASMLQLQKWILESDSARPQSLKYLHFGILEKKFTNSCLRQLSLASSVAPALDKRNHLSGWYKK